MQSLEAGTSLNLLWWLLFATACHILTLIYRVTDKYHPWFFPYWFNFNILLTGDTLM